jgi:hypothetical protein
LTAVGVAVAELVLVDAVLKVELVGDVEAVV